MPKSRALLYLLVAALLTLFQPPLLGGNADAHAQGAAAYKAETTRWSASATRFNFWMRAGVMRSPSGALQLDPSKARALTDPFGPGKYLGGNFYNGGNFFIGEATGPLVKPSFPFSEAVPSWNVDTPAGTWVEVLLRAHTGTNTSTGWTRWYSMGVWASGQEVVTRHSVSGQADEDAYVDVDTLKIGTRASSSTATAYQIKFRLFSTGRDRTPSLRSAAVAVSATPSTPSSLVPGDPALRGRVLDVSECSQMVYPEGGEVWCSPTSVDMVLGYWAGRTGPCEPGVRAAVSGVYDRVYRGHGNWPFNVAYASSQGMDSYVTRFTSMTQAEKWIAAGVPVIMSVSWGSNQLTGAPIPASNGHLMVLVGFDSRGDPVVNDPAAPSNTSVQRTYRRAELEKLWLQGSGGTAYLIYPPGRAVPKP